MPNISKILIANRGEIAVRVIHTCRKLGIPTVAVYSDADQSSPHVLLADESVHIGGAASSESYLVMDKIIDATRSTGADAIHPGYGFLSENAVFARKCAENEITFIGPTPDAIHIMGDKTEARKLMESAGIPLPPGTTSALDNPDDAIGIAQKIGYPVLIKAAAGGGGKGMRIVRSEADLKEAFRAARSEAKSAFGDDRVYVEKYLEEPRHIEVQIIADQHGNVLHLFDRECSVQRRHQKVVEEAPSPFMNEAMRLEITETAVRVAESCNYTGAGTVEFLSDKHKNFYFLEMNTRLQVEHPVTEMITGLDLVELQIRVANGEELPIRQSDVHIKGHAIECRISAEDPADNFLPSTGVLTHYTEPAGPGVRVDSGVREGQSVSINYDPLLAKLVCWSDSRINAAARMRDALSQYQISGLRTTIPFCKFVMENEQFLSGKYDTHFIADYFNPEDITLPKQEHLQLAAILLASRSESPELHNELIKSESSTNWWTRRRHN